MRCMPYLRRAQKHLYVCVYVCVCVCMCVSMYVYVYVYMYICIRVYIHTRIQTHIDIWHIDICTYTYTSHTHTHTHTRTHTHTHVHRTTEGPWQCYLVTSPMTRGRHNHFGNVTNHTGDATEVVGHVPGPSRGSSLSTETLVLTQDIIIYRGHYYLPWPFSGVPPCQWSRCDPHQTFRRVPWVPHLECCLPRYMWRGGYMWGGGCIWGGGNMWRLDE